MKRQHFSSSFLSILKLFRKLKTDEVEALIEHLTDNTVDSICECVFNVLNTDLKFSKRRTAYLKRHIKKKCNVHRIKTISNKKIPIFKRRKALKQEGKGLGLILASVIPFLSSLLSPK